MSSATLVRARRVRVALAPEDGWRPTLVDLLVGVWEGLRSDRTAACPVCGGAMLPRHGHGPRPVGGRCSDCSAELS